MSGRLRSLGGLARSLAIYRARPWRIARLARFYSGMLGPGDLAFDIGAHVGNRTRAMLRTGARVVALEPQSLFYGFLARDLPAEVTLLKLAAGPAAGSARLAVSRLHPTVSSLDPSFEGRMSAAPDFAGVRWDAGETVAMTTLDVLIADLGEPRFIKIDVEGFEPDVLSGLSRPIDWIAFEYLAADPATTRACVERVDQLGRYRFNFVIGERDTFAAREWTGGLDLLAALAAQDAGRTGDIYARREDPARG